MSRESFCDALRGGARTDKQPVQSPVISLALIGLLRTLPSLGRPDMTFGRALVRASAGLCYQRAKDRSYLAYTYIGCVRFVAVLLHPQSGLPEMEYGTTRRFCHPASASRGDLT